MNDVAVRALKTFLQAFLGVLIPELCIFLKEDFPVDMSFPAVVFAPMFCGALAAGISAVWNFVLKLLEDDDSGVIDVECDDFED